MTETEVSRGLGSAEREGMVGTSVGLPPAEGREGTVMEVAAGLMGVAGMSWWRYQARTVCGGFLGLSRG
jgi:hypothetical protein